MRVRWRRIVVLLTVGLTACGESPAPLLSEAAEPAFVGSTSCAACHQSQFDDWTGSHHQLAMQVANDATMLGDFSGIDFSYFDTNTQFLTRGSEYLVRTENAAGEIRDFPIAYTFGVEPMQQYLVKFPGGRLQTLPFAWDTRAGDDGGQRWFHLHPDEYIGPGDELHWTGPNYNWNFMCAECHSTNVTTAYDLASDTFDTQYDEISVGCEACHGPGSVHIAQAGAAHFDPSHGLPVDLDDLGTAVWSMNPETGIAERSLRIDRQQQPESCGRCHSRRSVIATDYEYGRPLTDTHMPSLLREHLYFADGQIQDEVYVYGSFLQSRMYRAGVTCTDCHNPHSGELVTGSDPNGVCALCHLPVKFGTAEHRSNRDADCVDCHMPARTYMGVDDRRDHSFRIVQPIDSATNATPGEHYGTAIQAGRNGPANRLLATAFQNTDYPAIARATFLTLLRPPPGQEGIAAVRRGLTEADPLIRIAALRALQSFPQDIRFELAPMLLDDPIRGVRIEAALAVADLRDLLSSEQSRVFRLAAEEFRAAQLTSASRPESLVNLADFEAATGNQDAAIDYLQHAVRIAPDFAPARHAFGLMLVRSRRPDEALDEFRIAAELAPEYSQFVYVLGVALNSLGHPDDALMVLTQARMDFPEDFDIGWALATMLRDAGRNSEALELANDLAGQFPANAEIAALRDALAGSFFMEIGK